MGSLKFPGLGCRLYCGSTAVAQALSTVKPSATASSMSWRTSCRSANVRSISRERIAVGEPHVAAACSRL